MNTATFIFESGLILDPDIENHLIRNNIKISLNNKGYACFYNKGKKELLHRYILKWPIENIDHINGDILDNRRCNLRTCEHHQNLWNMKTPSTNKSGTKGVCFDKYNCLWCAYIWVNKTRYRKKFKNKDDAIKWRKEKEIKYHGNFRRKS